MPSKQQEGPRPSTQTPPHAEEDVGPQDTQHRRWGCKRYGHFGRRFGAFLQNEHTPTLRSSIWGPWSLPKGDENYVHVVTCMWLFTAALFATAKTWTQPRCPSMGEWTNTLWSVQTMGYHLVIKRTTPQSREGTWRGPERIRPREESQS